VTGTARVLLIGFGNPGRLDDGLGPALAARINALKLPSVTVDSDYQLQVEYAEALSRYAVVVFADAAVAGKEPFYVEKVVPTRGVTFSSHSLSPADTLGLAQDLFGAETEGFMLGIRGYEFNEFGERLSVRAAENLEQACCFLESLLTLNHPNLITKTLHQLATGADHAA